MNNSDDVRTLLDRVSIRIGSAETDEQLQNAIFKFLPPVLLKLSSQQEGVRKKVMELLVHINKRVKSRPKIQLPVESLLLQYQDPAATSFVINFTIIYVKMGYPRMEMQKQAELAPVLINSLEGKPQSHQDGLLLMLMPVLSHIKVPNDPQQRQTVLGLSEKPRLRQIFLEFMLDVLLLPYGVTAQTLAKPSANDTAGNKVVPPPAFSENSFRRVAGENALKPEELEQTKLGIVKFLSSGCLPGEEIVVHLIIASSDSRHSVANTADMELKRLSSGTELNSSSVAKLYLIFLGTSVPKDQKLSMKQEDVKEAASIRIRLKIFAQLLKSREAALRFPFCIQIIFDCLYGVNTNQKLKIMAVQFVHNICLYCNDARIAPIGPVLLSGMLKLIAQATDDSKLRGLAFVAVGKLGQKLPQLITKDLDLIVTFFEALNMEDNDTRLSVQEALSLMLMSLKGLEPEKLKTMEALLLASVEKSEHQVRLLAVQFASGIFPPNNIPSRYLLLIAAGDGKDDVRNEALKALKGMLESNKKANKKNEPKFPEFPEFTTYICSQAKQRMSKNQTYVTGNFTFAFNPLSLSEILKYMRRCLWYSAGVTNLTEDFDESCTPDIATYVRHWLSTDNSEFGPIQMYLSLIKQLLSVTPGSMTMHFLLEVVATVPDLLAPYFINQIDWIKNFIYSMKEDVREKAALVYAIIVTSTLDLPVLMSVMDEQLQKVNCNNLEQQHGSMLALGHIIAFKLRHLNGNAQHLQESPQFVDALSKAMSAFVSALSHPQGILNSAACTALGEIGRSGFFPVKPLGSDLEFLAVVDELLKLLNSSKTNKFRIQEKTAIAVGHLCSSVQGVPHIREVLKGFLKAAVEIKEVEVQSTIGESLACAVLGPSSPSARNHWLVKEKDFVPVVKYEPEHIVWLFDEIINTHTNSAMVNIRQAACVWMLMLLKKCQHHKEVRDRLETIQQAFIGFLGENSDIIQDMASQGLGLVYECSVDEQRTKLVNFLVETLTSGSKMKKPVTADTQIFEEGAMPNPLGGNLTTYKELCSFATDLQQPDLVYKFMNLAKHNAMWTSKKGAAFGFCSIATQAGEQLKPFLPRIVPRLYRYQFDPNIKIQQSMMSIWQALVPEPQKTIDTYLKEIIDDIMAHLTDPSWRVRESSCLALSDILRGRDLENIMDRLPEMWETCFRVRDDIKESVRLAAESALKTLSKVSVKLCDSTVGKSSHQAIGLLLPVLLKKGLCSNVAEVQAISLQTVVKISKYAGIQLKPHLPLLVIALLDSFSVMESSKMDALSAWLGGQNEKQEKVDSLRVAMNRDTPMMTTLNHCVQYIDDSVIEELVSRLIDLIRTSVGLATKVGCATFVVTLTYQCPKELQPYSGKLMSAILHCLNDRNPVVRKNYASAIGHLVKVAKDSTVEKLINKLQTWYLEKEGSDVKSSCAFTYHAISRQSADTLKNHAARAVPLVFLAMHSPVTTADDDVVDYNVSVWEEVWSELTPGTETGIKLYLNEIIQIIQTGLQSPHWSLKSQAALAAATMAEKLESSLSADHQTVLLGLLLPGLNGRTWNGKEALLRAIGFVCTSCKDISKSSLKEVIDAVLKECHKGNTTYKQNALQCLTKILQSYDEDRLSDVLQVFHKILDKKDDDDSDDEREAKDREAVRVYRECAFELLGSAWPTNKETQEMYREEVVTSYVSYLNTSDWKTQIVIMKAMEQFMKRVELGKLQQEQLEILRLIYRLTESVNTCLGSIGYTSVRKQGLAVIAALLRKLKDEAKDNQLTIPSDLKNSILAVLNHIMKDSNPELISKCNDLMKTYETAVQTC